VARLRYQPREVSYERRLWPWASSLIEKETTLIDSAIIDCGSGFQPRFTLSDNHLQLFHKRFPDFMHHVDFLAVVLVKYY